MPTYKNMRIRWDKSSAIWRLWFCLWLQLSTCSGSFPHCHVSPMCLPYPEHVSWTRPLFAKVVQRYGWMVSSFQQKCLKAEPRPEKPRANSSWKSELSWMFGRNVDLCTTRWTHEVLLVLFRCPIYLLPGYHHIWHCFKFPVLCKEEKMAL